MVRRSVGRWVALSGICWNPSRLTALSALQGGLHSEAHAGRADVGLIFPAMALGWPYATWPNKSLQGHRLESAVWTTH